MEKTIKQILKARRMTQAQLAEAVGIGKGFLSEILSGKKSPSLKTLRSIADVLGIDAASLVSTPTSNDALIAAAERIHSALGRISEIAELDYSGFKDGDLEPFLPEIQAKTGSSADKVDISGQILQLGKLVCPNSSTLGLLRAKRTILAHGIKAQDFIIIDLRRSPTDGDTVIVQFYDAEVGSAATSLRYLNQGMLVPLDNVHAKIVPLDDPHIRIAGVMQAVLRAPQIN